MMKKVLNILILVTVLLTGCSYDEDVDVCQVSVALSYPANSINPYEGVRVELKDAKASVFVDSTDMSGMVKFVVPPGIYEASTSSVLITTNYKYIFNGVKSMIIISKDSTNNITLPLTMTKKRIVH
jgi:hypothetical protein